MWRDGLWRKTRLSKPIPANLPVNKIGFIVDFFPVSKYKTICQAKMQSWPVAVFGEWKN